MTSPLIRWWWRILSQQNLLRGGWHTAQNRTESDRQCSGDGPL
jgi:hypothetical protein